MPEPPVLFDSSLRRLRQARAQNLPPAAYLHRALATELHERLAEINKPFADRLVVGTMAGALAGDLGARLIPEGAVLDVAPESADLAIHALALHAANDPVGQLVQLRRALRPDGLMIAALFGAGTLQALREAFAQAELEASGGISPRVFPFGELRDLGALLQRAGFALPVADGLAWQVATPDLRTLLHDLRAMGETNVLAARRRSFLRRSILTRLEDILRATSPDGRGGILWRFELVFLTGWAPGPGQQKPLRPGSAAARLAEALKVPELPAGEKTGP